MLPSVLWSFFRPQTTAGLLSGILLFAAVATLASAAFIGGASYTVGAGLTALAGVDANPIETIGAGSVFLGTVYVLAAVFTK